jgi:hypothetical protein
MAGRHYRQNAQAVPAAWRLSAYPTCRAENWQPNLQEVVIKRQPLPRLAGVGPRAMEDTIEKG